MEWVEGDVNVAGVRLHYTRGGQGSPVLLLHGITDSGRCWGRTAATLAERHDVVLLDQRGHGRSDAPQGGYELRDFASDAAGVIRALGLAPAAVVGHSLGARVALLLAASFPDLVSRLVLEDPPLHTRVSAWTQEQRYAWFEWLRELKALSHEELIERCHAESPRWDAEECAAWAESKLAASPRLWEDGGIGFDSDWREELRALTCPVLLVRGDTELGSIVDNALATEVLVLARQGSDAHIAEAGHSIHRDQAADFAAAVVPYLSGRA